MKKHTYYAVIPDSVAHPMFSNNDNEQEINNESIRTFGNR